MTRARDLAKGTFSGDLTVDTNTLVVDSVNNRVGVGTASPTEEIHGYSSGGDFSLKLESASATGTAYTYYKNADRQWATGIRGSVGDSYQIIDSNADTARLVIDSSGRVTMPYQPHAQVYKNNGGNDTVSGGTTVVWNGVSSNIGNIYNVANGRFTVPVAGRYMVATVVLTGSTNKFGIYNVRRNGNLSFPDGWVQGHNYGTANDKALTFSGVVDLDANDYLDVYVNSSNNSLYWGGYNYMTVTLVG